VYFNADLEINLPPQELISYISVPLYVYFTPPQVKLPLFEPAVNEVES
jgi:hypothetical protein